jgi:hypothetical protein
MKTGPAAYDEHKATRITLYHVLITFALARVWIATTKSPDKNFVTLIENLRQALAASRYLDGPKTKWDQQFWAVMVFTNEVLDDGRKE